MSFEKLLNELPTLHRKHAPIALPFKATEFLRWMCTTDLSHGELLSARLVLGVWNPATDWVAEAKRDGLQYAAVAKRFDVLEAATVWDRPQLEALANWLLEANKFP